MNRREFLRGGAATGVLVSLRSDAKSHGRPHAEPVPIPEGTHAEALFPFKNSDLHFNLEDMMGILRDGDHESWRLTAYPDPTDLKVALIGAGFNLSVLEDIARMKNDPADPYQYNDRMRIDPSSAKLWEAAGLDKNKLDEVLQNFEKRKQRFGRNSVAYAAMDFVSHDISEEDARKLLYVSTRQAVHNAMAYTQDFDHMNGPQQLGMSQLVYQMGSHLEQFENFLTAVNDTSYRDPALTGKAAEKAEQEHWQNVQANLIDSKWYRKYHARAVEVVAMFDPQYDFAKPAGAEHRLNALAAKMKREHWKAPEKKPDDFTAREDAKPVTSQKQK